VIHLLFGRDVDKIHDVMDDIAEQQEVAKEISDAISSPFNHSDIDEKELEKELEELEQEELDKELLNIHLSSHGGTKTDEEGPAASPHAQPASTNSNNKDGQKSSGKLLLGFCLIEKLDMTSISFILNFI